MELYTLGALVVSISLMFLILSEYINTTSKVQSEWTIYSVLSVVYWFTVEGIAYIYDQSSAVIVDNTGLMFIHILLSAGTAVGILGIVFFVRANYPKIYRSNKTLYTYYLVAFLLLLFVATNPIHTLYAVVENGGFEHTFGMLIVGGFILASIIITSYINYQSRYDSITEIALVTVLNISFILLFVFVWYSSHVILVSLGTLFYLVVFINLIDRNVLTTNNIIKNQLFDSLNIPIIVTDKHNQIINYNTNADEIISDSARNITDVFQCDSFPSKTKIGGNFYTINRVSVQDMNSRIEYIYFVYDIDEEMEMINSKNKELQKLYDGIQHEIRNCLQVIKGNTELLLEQQDNNQLQTIQEMTERLDRIVDDISYIAKIESERDNQNSQQKVTSVLDVAHGKQNVGVEVEDETTEIVVDEQYFELLVRKLGELAQILGDGESIIKLKKTQIDVHIQNIDINNITKQGLFEYGEAVPNAASGSILPVVEAISSTQSWDIRNVSVTEDTIYFELHSDKYEDPK